MLKVQNIEVTAQSEKEALELAGAAASEAREECDVDEWSYQIEGVGSHRLLTAYAGYLVEYLEGQGAREFTFAGLPKRGRIYEKIN
jgi:hypothetical protein